MLPLLSFILLISVNSFVNAKEIAEIKCHVELVGGGETIHFAEVAVKGSQFNKADVKSLSIMATNSRHKHDIFKVKECVMATAKFRTGRAQTLEKSLVW